MDSITDFFKELKSRITNPLIVSFMISWLIINWRVPVGILGYKPEELRIDGYVSYSDLISKNASWWNYLYLPLILALGYTFVFPGIRMVIFAFLTFVKKKSDNWNTEIMKDYHVPMSRFVKQKEKYAELADALNKIYTEDSQTVIENAELKEKMVTLNNDLALEKKKALEIPSELINIKNSHNKYTQLNNISSIEGEWHFTQNMSDESNYKRTFIIIIQENDIAILNSIAALPYAKILLFNYNYVNEEIAIVFEHKKFDPSSSERPYGNFDHFDVHKLKLGYRGRTEIITDLEGRDRYGNLVQYSRSEKTISALIENFPRNA